MDLMMMRDQYEKLCEIAPSEFKHPYFFQTEYTEHGFGRWFARLRNSETTGIQKLTIDERPTYNQGIFIDIFPLDSVADETDIYLQQNKVFCHYTRLYRRYMDIEQFRWGLNDFFLKKVAKSMIQTFASKIVRDKQLSTKAYRKADAFCQINNKKDTELVSLLSFQYDNLVHALRRVDMGDIIHVDFEFMSMPIIANYDEHLKRKYGDYMTPVHNPNYHGDMIFDTNMSYINYYKYRLG